MTVVFADTSFCVALANPRDIHHANALQLARRRFGHVVTTEYVMIEVGNWLSRTGDRPSFLALMEQIDADQEATVVPGSGELFGNGFDLYRQRPDKEWSMTDCISFVIMRQREITEAMTADHHFEQAGFTMLLKG